MHKYGLKALGVSLMAVFGLMAFFAIGAQAANLSDGGVAGNFRVEGLSTLVKGTKFTGTQEGAGKLLIGSKNAFVECKTGTVTAAEGLSESEVTATVLFEECATFEDKLNAEKKFPELKACDVLGEPASTGKVEAKGIGKAKLHEGELYVLLSGSPFATLKFGEECGIGVKVAVSGSVVAKVISGSTEATSHLIEFSEAIQRLFQKRNAVTDAFEAGDRLLYGAAEAFITASANVSLTGTHVNKNWSVI
jgi:hypothetical protein